MKFDKLVGERFKERPADCVIDSHALMTRGGYMKYVGNGIFSSFHVLKRITRKIEQVIREEMDALDGQEVSFPVTMPAALWQESGRYDSVGRELLRFTDRNDAPMVLGMTHEETAVHLVREYGNTYAKYPFMIYQIQTKFRDEARPRAGLIRVREFTMKDAYSFHTSQADLEAYYECCLEAYHRIFRRAGVPEVIAVLADSGMMGGKISHEFMLLTPVGEDSIVRCPSCGYVANMETAGSVVVNEPGEAEALTKVHTPHQQTIETVCAFLRLPIQNSCKTVVYQKDEDDRYVCVFVRGDLEINETKVRNFIKSEIRPAIITPESGLCAGYLGPYGLAAARAGSTNTGDGAAPSRIVGASSDAPNVRRASCTDSSRAGDDTAFITGATCRSTLTVLYDQSLAGIESLCCGANEDEYHYTGLNIPRDIGAVDFHDFAKAADGGICPACGSASLTVARGIEVGNIFQLGTKYTEAMNMQFTDPNGQLSYPIMGCYGIGVGRLAASVCEAHHDDYGPIWPMGIAPWQVHLCCVRADDPQAKAQADDLYRLLLGGRLEVIYDDRAVSAGMMFSDADLLGVPVRMVVSPRNLKEGQVEIATRDKSVQKKVAIGEAVAAVRELVEGMC